MEKQLHLYEVSSCGRSKAYIYAESSSKAKRVYCKNWGVSPSDYWCGVSSLHARKLTAAEESARIEQEKTERTTYTFIKGMLDICVMNNIKKEIDPNVTSGKAIDLID